MGHEDYRKFIHVIGGGTVSHVRNHLALSAPAYGTTARRIAELAAQHPENELEVQLHLTCMANRGEGDLETNADVAALVDRLVADPATKIIFFNPALIDFDGSVGNVQSGKHAERLHSRDLQRVVGGELEANFYGDCTFLQYEDVGIRLQMAPKILGRIRRARKDITLVAFKTTTGATEQEQYLAALELMKENSCNLVLANDVVTRVNMIVTPEEARYHVTTDREEALRNLVDMAILRSHLTFTRSTVVSGEPVPWDHPDVPAALRAAVDHCIKEGAYKPFRGATVGHFAVKVGERTFLTSRRKTNFNDLAKNGLVRIETDGPDTVIAYGSKPSVGGQSQRIIFGEHEGYDCIVHFHCPMREDAADDIPVVSQREYECGSHQCGQNTSNGLKQFGELKAVMLDQHGPNIVFPHDVDPAVVISFIDRNFDLSAKTGGPVQ